MKGQNRLTTLAESFDPALKETAVNAIIEGSLYSQALNRQCQVGAWGQVGQHNSCWTWAAEQIHVLSSNYCNRPRCQHRWACLRNTRKTADIEAQLLGSRRRSGKIEPIITISGRGIGPTGRNVDGLLGRSYFLLCFLENTDRIVPNLVF